MRKNLVRLRIQSNTFFPKAISDSPASFSIKSAGNHLHMCASGHSRRMSRPESTHYSYDHWIVVFPEIKIPLIKPNNCFCRQPVSHPKVKRPAGASSRNSCKITETWTDVIAMGRICVDSGIQIFGSWRLTWDTLRDRNSAARGRTLWQEFALFCTARRLATLG